MATSFAPAEILTVGRMAADISGNRRSIATDAATNGNELLVSGCNRFVSRQSNLLFEQLIDLRLFIHGPNTLRTKLANREFSFLKGNLMVALSSQAYFCRDGSVEPRCNSAPDHPRADKEDAVMGRTAALPALKAESGLSRYLDEIRRFPMLEPQEEYMLARSWREHGDREAVHKLVTSHLRLVAKIAMGYRGYGLPISEVISEGNVGLMQAVKRFEPERGFRLATYAMWWIKAGIQEYILRSWSLVKMGTTANQKKLFFNLRKAKSKISALEEGDLRPDQVQVIAKRLGVTEQDVVDMNRRLGGDASLNAPIRDDGESGEWQDWLVDDAPTQERILAESEESDNRHKALVSALDVLNERERRIFEARRLVDDPITLEDLASEFGVSRERVRQIEVRAFEKVQKAVKNRIAAIESQAALAALPAA